jgi:hypothetical protein
MSVIGPFDHASWKGDGQFGSYSGPEVLLEEIAIDLLQARFWITFGWSTTRPQ